MLAQKRNRLMKIRLLAIATVYTLISTATFAGDIYMKGLRFSVPDNVLVRGNTTAGFDYVVLLLNKGICAISSKDASMRGECTGISTEIAAPPEDTSAECNDLVISNDGDFTITMSSSCN